MLVCDVRHQKHLIFQLGLLSIPEPLGALLPAPAQGSTSSPMQCWQCYEFSRLSSLLPLLPSPHGNCLQFPGTSPRLGHGALAKCCLDILAVNVQETRGRPARKKKTQFEADTRMLTVSPQACLASQAGFDSISETSLRVHPTADMETQIKLLEGRNHDIFVH